MKTNTLYFLIGLYLFSSPLSAQQSDQSLMPLTAHSEKAIELYTMSIAAMENAEINRGINLLNEAIEEDPGFFMANLMLGLQELYRGNQKKAGMHFYRAANCPRDLSAAEMVLRKAAAELLVDIKADMTLAGKEITQMHPRDKNTWYILATFQTLANDPVGALDSYRAVLDIADNPAPAYNMIGYMSMQTGDMAGAAKAFDKYIELMPNHPNPYDSKGDYYMQNGEYDKAYESYIKAHKLNDAWSYNKAMKARELSGEQAIVLENLNINGAWKLVAVRWILNDSVKYEMPGNMKTDQVKIWSGNQFSCIGNLYLRDELQHTNVNFAGGEYSLNGENYSESIRYHQNQDAIGSNVKMRLQMKGDTLIQVWPVDGNGNVDQLNCSFEKYVRLDDPLTR